MQILISFYDWLLDNIWCPMNTYWNKNVKALWLVMQIIVIWESWKVETWGTHLRKNITQLRRRQWHPTPVLLPGKSHGGRSLVGCSPWGCTESDMTERLHFHFSLSCIGEGNGNPPQCSCLGNFRNGGAWWAAVYGVAQSRTRLKQLSSSSSSMAGTMFALPTKISSGPNSVMDI